MEAEKIVQITPDKKLKDLLSSCIAKPFNEYGRKRKRSVTEESSEKTDQSTKDRDRKKNVDSQDEDAFFERVESFDMINWFAKPIELSPLVCSSYGWKNTEADMLKCVGCNAVLCGQLPKQSESLIYQESCKKLTNNLRMAHQKSCFWPAYPSPESFSLVPVKDKRKVRSNVITYIKSLQNLQQRLPLISFKSFEDKGISANYIEEVKCLVEKQWEYDHIDNVELSTFILAVTGWKVSDPKTSLLSCHYCRRKVGLWNYRNSQNESIDSEDSGEDSDIEMKSCDDKTGANESLSCTENVNSPENSTCITATELSTGEENNFNFSQPNVLICESADSQNKNDGNDISLSPPKIFKFSQPNIVEDDNKIDHLMADKSNEHADSDSNECNKQFETELKNNISQDTISKVEQDIPDKNGDLKDENVCHNKNKDNEYHNLQSNGDQNHMLSQCRAEYNINITEKSNLSSEEKSNSNKDNDIERKGDNMVEGSPERTTVDTPDNTAQVQSKEVTESPRKKIKVVKKDSFDPLEEHRYWCPWINQLPESTRCSPKKISEISDGEKKKQCPWELILQIISHSYDGFLEDSVSEHFKQHSPIAGLRQLRSLIKEWEK